MLVKAKLDFNTSFEWQVGNADRTASWGSYRGKYFFPSTIDEVKFFKASTEDGGMHEIVEGETKVWQAGLHVVQDGASFGISATADEFAVFDVNADLVPAIW